MKSVVDLVTLLNTKFGRKQALEDEVTTRATLGAHNLFDKNRLKNVANQYTIYRPTSTGGNVSVSQAVNAAYAKIGILDLKKNTVYHFSTDFTITSGHARFNVRGVLNETGTNIYISDVASASGAFSFDFNSGNYDSWEVNLYCTDPSVQENGDVTYNNILLRLASDTDTTYTPYVPTNSQLLSYKDNGVLGAKNWLNVFNTQTTGGTVTFTVNSDGSVTANGTATGDESYIVFSNALSGVEANTDYILTGCPSGGAGDTYYLQANYKNSSGTQLAARDFGSGVTYNTKVKGNFSVYIYIKTGQTVSNLTFKPMLRLASDTDPTYQPYAMTNKELTDFDDNISNTWVEENYGGNNVYVTADGVKTTKTLLNELANAALAKVQTLNDDERLMPTMLNYADEIYAPKNPRVYYQNNATSLSPTFLTTELNSTNSNASLKHIRIHTTLSGNTKSRMIMTTTGNTFKNDDDSILENGKTIVFYYVIRKLVK